MKKLLSISILTLAALTGFCATPDFGDFELTQFATNNNKIAIKAGAIFTNAIPTNVFEPTQFTRTAGTNISFKDGALATNLSLVGVTTNIVVATYSQATLPTPTAGRIAYSTNATGVSIPSLMTADGSQWLMAGTRNPKAFVEIYEDWLSGTGVGNNGFTVNASGGAATLSTTQLDTNKPGVLELATGTGTTGRANVNNGGLSLFFGGGEAQCVCLVHIPVLSVVGDEYIIRIGFGDIASSADHTDGAYFEYDRLTAGDFWRVKTANNSTRTAVDTTTAVVAGTWIELKVVVNAAGTEARFYINGTEVAGTGYPITTNIPITASRSTGLGMQIVKSAGTTTRLLNVDYFWMIQKFTTSR